MRGLASLGFIVSVTWGQSSYTASTLAGTGVAGYDGDGRSAALAKLNSPWAVAYDRLGNLYVADYRNHCVRQVSVSGVITTVAGTGEAGYSGDLGRATSARLDGPWAVAVSNSGMLLIADSGNHRIRQVVNGVIATVAGNGTPGYSGDGGNAPDAALNSPQGVAFDSLGSFYIADTGNHRIRRVSGTLISTVAGSTAGFSGDDGPPTAAKLLLPHAIALDSANQIYIADTGNHRVRLVKSNNVISTVAGNGLPGFSGDLGPATAARLNYPTGIAVDPSWNLFIADSANQRIRRVPAGGAPPIFTIAGNGTAGPCGDSLPAALAQFNGPWGIALDTSGSVIVSDFRNHRIRKLTAGPPRTPVQMPRLFPGGIFQAASYASSSIAPGVMVSLFGAGLGPAAGLEFRLNDQGVVDTMLGGTRVLFDGTPAPLVYVRAELVSAVAPYALDGKSCTQVQVEYQGVLSDPAPMPVAAARPGIFTIDSSGKGRGAILNENGSVNSPANPAKKGSIVVIYATGEGQTDPPGVDGRVAEVVLPKPLAPVWVLFASNLLVHPIYAGAAPTQFAGVMQINARVPDSAPSGSAVPVMVFAGNARSQPGVTLAVE
ncbi:MAG: hypothetical protein HYR60_26925 [Acidobacteria bacterium]|nr:hypothetical protein [Acidobacteriota bacterium]